MRAILALSIALAVAMVASIWFRESGTQQISNTAKPASVAAQTLTHRVRTIINTQLQLAFLLTSSPCRA